MTSSIPSYRSSVVFYAAVALLAIAYANPKTANADTIYDGVFDIRENDGLGMVVPGTPNKIGWDLIIKNNSNTLPVGNPIEASVIQATIHSVYSFDKPTFGSITGYNVFVVFTGIEGLWDFSFDPKDFFENIFPGDSKVFPIFTTLPAGYTYDDLVIGDLYGQGLLQGEGWQPAAPGDSFKGPVGILPLPDTNGDDIVDAADYGNLVEQLGGPPDNEESADFNGDGFVDLEDFARLRSKYGFGVALAPEFGASAPEPATLTMLALVGLAVLRRRRKLGFR